MLPLSLRCANHSSRVAEMNLVDGERRLKRDLEDRFLLQPKLDSRRIRWGQTESPSLDRVPGISSFEVRVLSSQLPSTPLHISRVGGRSGPPLGVCFCSRTDPHLQIVTPLTGSSLKVSFSSTAICRLARRHVNKSSGTSRKERVITPESRGRGNGDLDPRLSPSAFSEMNWAYRAVHGASESRSSS